MILRIFSPIFSLLSRFLEAPKVVLIFCMIMVSVSLILDNSLMKLWKLNKNKEHISSQISNIKKDIVSMKKEIDKSKDSEYLAQIAVERFDLIKDGDLIFVFTE